jgi:hypothetical protein
VGIDLDEVRRSVEEAFGPGALDRGRGARAGHIPFTRGAKKALELSLHEALASATCTSGPTTSCSASSAMSGARRRGSSPLMAWIASACAPKSCERSRAVATSPAEAPQQRAVSLRACR